MRAFKYLALAALCWAAISYGRTIGASHERKLQRQREREERMRHEIEAWRGQTKRLKKMAEAGRANIPEEAIKFF